MKTGFLKGLWPIPILLFLSCNVTYQGQMWDSPQRGVLSGRVSLEDGHGWDDVEVLLVKITGPQQPEEEKQLWLESLRISSIKMDIRFWPSMRIPMQTCPQP